jgi:hypothetical protein
MSEQYVPKYDGVVMNLVVCRIDERHRTFACKLSKVREQLGMSMDLFRVAALELVPSAGIMTEPFAKLRAGGEILQPFVDAGLDFGYPAGP